MIVLQLIMLGGLIAISVPGSGLFFVRYLKWSPVEKLCASIALSLVLIYLGSLAIFWLDLPNASHWLLSGICLILSLACWRDLLRLYRPRGVRAMLGGFAFVLIWTSLILLCIRHYAGGTWSGDWLEHYQRSLFFLDHADLNYRFLNQYLLTDRPPMMNLICGHFMAQTSERFEIYQATAAFLNLLPIFPCAIFARWIAPNRAARRISMIALPIILAANPLFMQNVAYVWTKSFAAFFALLSLWLYMRGWRKGLRSYIVAAFVTAAAGCTVHYYIVPWTLVLAAHYLFVVWPKRAERWGELGWISILAAIIPATWFAWAIENYGWATTFTSNLTVSNHTPGASVNRLAKIWQNLYATIVPYFLRHVPYQEFQQNDSLGRVRDLAFCLYQTNLIFAFGVAGATVLIFIIIRHRASTTQKFLLIFLAASGVLGVAAAPVAEDWGVAHLALQPHVLLGLAAISGVFGALPKVWRWIVVAGCFVDFVTGILLQVYLEHRVFQLVQVANGNWTFVSTPQMLGHSAQFNFFMKQQLGLQFLGDLLPSGFVFFAIAMVILLLGGLIRLVFADGGRSS
jgi:hypothetical protein